MALTDFAIRNLKSTGQPFKASDSGGRHLLVNPNGSRLWRLKYRYEGKEKLLALGAYPIVTLAKAREKRDEAKAQLADGIDPAKSRRESRIAAVAISGNTFRLVAEEYLDKLRREGRAPATLAKVEWLLSFAYGDLGERPISEIAAAEVLAVLRKVEQRGRRESARRLRSTVGSVFRYAIATARAENDPTFALRGALVAPKVKHRAALIGTAQLGAFLRALDSFDGQVTTRTALALLPLLFPRPGELRAAEWAEFDLDKALWTIPAARMKMRRPHRIPLPTQAVALLRELHLHTGTGRLVFPSVRSTLRSISENTLNAALRRMGYTTDEVTAHGFRATASTLLNESSQWNADAIERQLAHEDADAIRRAYARGEHWDKRVRMMQWWADKLEAWKGEG